MHVSSPISLFNSPQIDANLQAAILSKTLDKKVTLSRFCLTAKKPCSSDAKLAQLLIQSHFWDAIYSYGSVWTGVFTEKIIKLLRVKDSLDKAVGANIIELNLGALAATITDEYFKSIWILCPNLQKLSIKTILVKKFAIIHGSYYIGFDKYLEMLPNSLIHLEVPLLPESYASIPRKVINLKIIDISNCGYRKDSHFKLLPQGLISLDLFYLCGYREQVFQSIRKNDLFSLPQSLQDLKFHNCLFLDFTNDERDLLKNLKNLEFMGCDFNSGDFLFKLPENIDQLTLDKCVYKGDRIQKDKPYVQEIIKLKNLKTLIINEKIIFAR